MVIIILKIIAVPHLLQLIDLLREGLNQIIFLLLVFVVAVLYGRQYFLLESMLLLYVLVLLRQVLDTLVELLLLHN